MLGTAGESDHDSSPWDGRRTLFEVLGVPEEATQKDIEEAYGRHLEGALRAGREVSANVRFARNRLLDDTWRQFYRDRLIDCRTEQPLKVGADKVAGFIRFCEQAKIAYWPDRVAAGEYHLRLPGQDPPDFVVEEQRTEQRKKLAESRETKREEDRLYKRTHAGKIFFLRFGYLYAFAFAGIAVVGLLLMLGFDGTFSRWLRVSDVLEVRETKGVAKEGQEALALASDAATQLESALNSLRDAVQRELKVSLENKPTVSAELKAVIDKEPTVAAAWKKIQEAYENRSGLDWRKSMLSAAAGRIQAKSFLKADVESLQELRTWTRQAMSAVTSQKENIDHIRAVLEVERFSRASDRPSKEP